MTYEPRPLRHMSRFSWGWGWSSIYWMFIYCPRWCCGSAVPEVGRCCEVAGTPNFGSIMQTHPHNLPQQYPMGNKLVFPNSFKKGPISEERTGNIAKRRLQGHPFPEITHGFWFLVSAVDFVVDFFGSFSLEKKQEKSTDKSIKKIFRVHAKGVVLCERTCFCLLSTF